MNLTKHTFQEIDRVLAEKNVNDSDFPRVASLWQRYVNDNKTKPC